VSSPYVGEIRMFAGNFAPVGWAFCQGQIMAISENETLFNLIGTLYGGDGQSTFALPNLSSRIPIHTGPGFLIGQQGGEESVTLTVSQIPAHSHLPLADANQGGSTDPTNNAYAGAPVYVATAPSTLLKAGTIQNAGGSQPHDNMVPFLVVNFIISLFGIFPSQT